MICLKSESLKYALTLIAYNIKNKIYEIFKIALVYSFEKNDEKKIELISNQIINFYLFLLILYKRISNRQNKNIY